MNQLFLVNQKQCNSVVWFKTNDSHEPALLMNQKHIVQPGSFDSQQMTPMRRFSHTDRFNVYNSRNIIFKTFKVTNGSSLANLKHTAQQCSMIPKEWLWRTGSFNWIKNLQHNNALWFWTNDSNELVLCSESNIYRLQQFYLKL